ncbi:MAG TPA: XRE family transcriptional regulator [Candidatus Krumholzibacteria bacterium]|nr:XRE family transcriptional regulator [Candidatus Krumholzibacteria bacterium]
MPGLGERIKALRLAHDLTLKEVGTRASLSPTHLSEIERGLTSPTVGALLRIAGALGETASRLVEDDPGCALAVTRGPRRRIEESGVSIELRCTAITPGEISVLEIELPPGSEAPRLAVCGEQFLLVTAGSVQVTLTAAVHTLREGDALHCTVDECRTIRNRAEQSARLLWIAAPAACL